MRLTISYCDSSLHFSDDPGLDGCPVPSHFLAMDDNSLDRCFEALLEQRDVWVWCRGGMRRVVAYCRERFVFVKAAGGLVTAADGTGLLIRRDGRWDLPKGMVEPGETVRAAARREVQEETGLDKVSVGRLLVKTYHIYDKYGGWHLKQTCWYAMRADTGAATSPQQEEGITQALWLPIDCCLRHLRDSFASLRVVASKASDMQL